MRLGLAAYAVGMLIDKAQLLTLTAPQITVLLRALRMLNANTGKTHYGLFTQQPEVLSNEFFVNLVDMRTQWRPSAANANVLDGRNRRTGELKWTGTRGRLDKVDEPGSL